MMFAGRRRDDLVVSKGSGSYVELVSLVAVFVGAAVTTVVSLTAFVAVYVYVEAVRNPLTQCYQSTQHSPSSKMAGA